MNINLKPYQEKAVDKLVARVTGLLSRPEKNKNCVFQAPTGSGKTLMTAKFIEEIIKELPDQDMCFVWVSIGKGDLHLQSKHSLEHVFGGSPRVSLVEEEFTGGRDRIALNEVVVVNWEKLRSKDRETGYWKNILMKDGEKINFRDVLARTREQAKIILIIDESHIGATAERTNELRSEIDAEVTIEMSATPKISADPREIERGTAAFIFVEPKDVIDEGMIKKELIINEKIDQIPLKEIDSQEIVLEAAYGKRLELCKLFKSEKSIINPLVLIQIPTAEAGEDKIRAVREYLKKKGITEKYGRLAIWLSEQKSETLDWISKPDNEIEFLIFKQAIDTGWDCPRAHILVKFRESHSETFEIQTVGRIMRMPEQKHYDCEELNRGYIYTNVQSIIVKKETYNPNIIKHLKSCRTDSYKNIDLLSFYRSRIDFGDIGASFADVYEKTFCKYFGINIGPALPDKNVAELKRRGIALDINKYQQDIILDARVDGKTFDEIEGQIDSEEHARLTIAGNDLQALFEQVIKTHLGSFKNIKRSLPDVKSAIYNCFRKQLGTKRWKEEILLIQKIIVDNGNRSIFEEILTKAINEYGSIREKEIREKAKKSEQVYRFEINKVSFFNEHSDEVVKVRNYAHVPCYLNIDRLTPERRFEEFLNKNSDLLTWWWKNGENIREYFGIRYEYPQGITHTFYPDYLVQLKDGRIGILEAKDMHDREGATYTKAKAERLGRYIKEQNRKELFGGIVIEQGGDWKINNREIFDWEKCAKNDWSDWEKLVL